MISAKIVRRSLVVGCATVLIVAVAESLVAANVGDPKNWKPNFEKSFKAPPHPDEAARIKAFDERNSKPKVEQLAKEFFTLIDLSKTPDAIRTAVEKGDYESALNSYRDFFMERLATLSPDENENMGVRPRQPPFPFEKAFLHTADDLMSGTVVYGVMDLPLPNDMRFSQNYYDICNNKENQVKKGNARVEFGAPGKANWTWQPDGIVPLGFPAFPFDKSFMSAAFGRPHFFTPLLVKYIETKEVKYWDRWIAYMDDICINWRRDTMKAGLNPSHNQNNIEFFDDGLLANLSFLMQKSPEMVKSIPAPTLARLLNRMWMAFMSDSLQYGRNASTARRIMFDTYHGVRLGTTFPEFKASRYCIREAVRALESLPMVSLMPDNTDVHDSRNYNKSLPEYLFKVYTMMKKSGQAPPEVNEQWYKNLYEYMKPHANFIIRELWVTGAYPHWSLLRDERGVFTGQSPYLKRYVPEVFEDPDNAKIVSNLFEDGKLGAPSFSSDAFPYSGYYCMRTGWTKQDFWLYLPSTRPVASITHPNNNNFSLYAYGQHLLADTGMSPPILVDGCNQIENGAYRAVPQRYKTDQYKPMYGRTGSANAYRTPLANRWHTSEFFDLVEGEYSGPFARVLPDTFIDDVTHNRQILFSRKLGLYVVTDRMISPTPHAYDWRWPFYYPGPEDAKRYPGFKRNEMTADKVGQTLKTHALGKVNLSLYSFAQEPMEMTESGFKVNQKSNWMVVSALYPRKPQNDDLGPDLSELKAMPDASGALGFSTNIPGGGRVLFQAAPSGGALALEDIVCNGESILLATMPDGARRGVALGIKEMAIGGVKQTIPCADFEFLIKGNKLETTDPIYRPIELPKIGPEEDTFSDAINVTLSHADPGMELRYTLDGTDPGIDSPLYSAPIIIKDTTTVKTRAVRKGVTNIPKTSDNTRVSPIVRALFTRRAPLDAVKADTKPGLDFTYYEDNGTWPISAINLEAMTPAGKGTCSELFDVSATKMKQGGFAFIYTGYLTIANDGVYSIHAPREFITPSIHSGYDLRIYIDGLEWYPATQIHNFGAWSVPLKSGLHAFKVVYINQQNVHLMSDFEHLKDFYWSGAKPSLTISGPGLNAQPIPASMLCR